MHMRRIDEVSNLVALMNHAGMKTWMAHAREALAHCFEEQDVETIVDWFWTIKSRKERDLVGSKRVDAFSEFQGDDYFSVYTSMMSRMWVYAPYIVAESRGLISPAED